MTYNEDQIRILSEIEAVRERPHMYIGSTEKANHLFTEILDNSIDEYLAGHCDDIFIKISPDGHSIAICDNGRGIPIGINKETGKYTPEVIFTKLHAGGKFNSKAYNSAGGLHGVGSTCVNFLSSKFIVKIYREGKQYKQVFLKGVAQPPEITPSDEEVGTVITFTPDKEIFDDTEFDIEWLKERCEFCSFLNKGLTVTISDKDNKTFVYNKSGIDKLLTKIYEEEKFILPKNILLEDDFVKVSFQFVKKDDGEKWLSYANNIYTDEGGYHVSGFRNGYLKALKDSFENNKFKHNFFPIDYRSGLVFIVSLKIAHASYKGQTKNQLINKEAEKIVHDFTYEKMLKFLNENPKVLKKIFEIIKENEKVRIAVKKTKELNKTISTVSQKGDLLGLRNSGKLTDCYSKDTSENELWICEGQSASGSMKNARKRSIQAVYPLRGKVLNVSKIEFSRALNNEEISGLLKAIGCGIGKNYNPRKQRYGKIILACDADVDGLHIQALLLGLFYKITPELIENGSIYISHPPLFKVTKGTKVFYVDKIDPQKHKDCIFTRFKGLGEMDSEDLEICMDPKTRKLTQISLENIEQVKKDMDMCVGNDGVSRKDMILNLYKK